MLPLCQLSRYSGRDEVVGWQSLADRAREEAIAANLADSGICCWSIATNVDSELAGLQVKKYT